MDELTGRVAVVTGAASGIGFALCERFAAEGMRVVMADVDADRLAAAAAQLAAAGAAEVLAVPTNVALWADVESLATRAVERFGAVHVLCNNAGVSTTGVMWEIELDDWDWLLGINLWGVIHGIKAFAPGMIEHGQPAHIVNTASMSGLIAFPQNPPYTASKYAIVGLSESLHHQLAARGGTVGVSVLCPGRLATSLRETSDRSRPSGAVVRPDRSQPVVRQPAEAAEQVVDAILHDRFWILTHPEYLELIERRAHGILTTDDVVKPV